jgi:hypothetical protein
MATAKPPRRGARHRDTSTGPAQESGLSGSAFPAEAGTSGFAAGEYGGEPAAALGATPDRGTAGQGPIAHEVSAYVTAQAGRSQLDEPTTLPPEPIALLPASTDTGSGDILVSVQDYARRHPATFLGGAFVLGLTVARFLKSSARRRPGRGAGRRGRRRVAVVRAAVVTGQGAYGSTGVALEAPGGPRDPRSAGRRGERDSVDRYGRS